jgi:tetratricopeptide (TPR) repeat protein
MAATLPSWELDFNQGVAAIDEGRNQDALLNLNAALGLARGFQPGDVRLMKSMYALALAHQIQGEPDLAEQLYLEARSAIDAAGEPARPLRGYVLQGIGQLRFDQGRWKEAEDLLRQAIRECTSYGGPSHSSTFAAERHLGEVLAAEGSTVEAEQIFENLIVAIRRSPSIRPDFLAGSLANLAALYVHEDRFDLAEPLLRESFGLASQRGTPRPVLADTLLGLGEMYRLEHSCARAEPPTEESAQPLRDC